MDVHLADLQSQIIKTYNLNETGVTWFKNSKWQKARSWLFTSMAEKLNSQLSRNNSR